MLSALLTKGADRLSRQAEWRLVHRVADAAIPVVARRVLHALESLTLGPGLLEHLENGDANGALVDVNLRPLAEGLAYEAMPALQRAYARTGQAVVQSVPRRYRRLVRKETQSVAFAFNATNPRALEWAAQHSASLVTRVTEETRLAVRAVIASGFADQLPPRTLARRVRQLVGLTERSALGVEHLRARLVDVDTVADVVERRVEFAAARALRDRAMLIARTEVMGASNAGQLEAWRQGLDEGAVDRALVKEWIVTDDERLCPLCEPLDGEQAPIEASFSGGVLSPPLHPACRCAVGLAVPR